MTAEGGQARQHYNVTFALLALVAVSYALLQSLVAPALPDIQRALHTSVNAVSWVLTAYLLSASIATPLIGRLGDMYGKRRLLVAILVVLCAATVVSALATSLAVMLVGRVAQGAAGGIFPLAFGIIRDEFPRDRVAGAVGIMSALAGVGGGAGVVLAGPIVRDKIWFMTAHRRWGRTERIANLFHDTVLNDPFFTPADGTNGRPFEPADASEDLR